MLVSVGGHRAEGYGPQEHLRRGGSAWCQRAQTAAPMARVGRVSRPSPCGSQEPVFCAGAYASGTLVWSSLASSKGGPCGHRVWGAGLRGRTHRGAALGNVGSGVGVPSPASLCCLPLSPQGRGEELPLAFLSWGCHWPAAPVSVQKKQKGRFRAGFIWITEGAASVTKMEFTVCCYIHT